MRQKWNFRWLFPIFLWFSPWIFLWFFRWFSPGFFDDFPLNFLIIFSPDFLIIFSWIFWLFFPKIFWWFFPWIFSWFFLHFFYIQLHEFVKGKNREIIIVKFFLRKTYIQFGELFKRRKLWKIHAKLCFHFSYKKQTSNKFDEFFHLKINKKSMKKRNFV